MESKITVKTISNITKADWTDFFKDNSIKGFTPHVSSASYEPLKRYLNNHSYFKDEVNRKLVNDFIFNNIAIEKSNQHYLYGFRITNALEADFLEENDVSSLNIDKSFFDDINGGSNVRLFTSRVYEEEGNLENIILLIKVGETTDEMSKNFFVTVNIDFKNSFFNINFSKNSLKFVDAQIGNLLYTVKTYLESNVFGVFNIIPVLHNEYTLKKALFNLYAELSDRIEERLEGFLPDDMQAITARFLDEINVEYSEKFLNQITAILYQDRSGLDNIQLYPDGWVSRFLFQDGDCTRASSRTDQLEPIYTSPIYWNLKELIRGKNELLDVGFVWMTTILGENVNIYVRLDVSNENLSVYYYQKGQYTYLRREKENYVRQKIREVLQTN
ncbi:hypothetical protein [Sporosarcina sp. P17b]|uniref:hypothetical protein n=1 Tax=Sporosarcina sp. P17b TaxID=2048260 RepID=UPI000C16C260|nr:hypothetical protein [Sporosarcina sp. P17b]PIC72485.1 hypothetical protein CSV76_14740 [Sporosarcina sp. P17b]